MLTTVLWNFFPDETTGATDDWSYGVAGIKYSYNPELRGNGFAVPPSEIEPSFQEIWAGWMQFVESIEGIEGFTRA